MDITGDSSFLSSSFLGFVLVAAMVELVRSISKSDDAKVDVFGITSDEFLADTSSIGQESVFVSWAVTDREALASIQLKQFVSNVDKGNEVMFNASVAWRSGRLTLRSQCLMDINESLVLDQQLSSLFRCQVLCLLEELLNDRSVLELDDFKVIEDGVNKSHGTAAIGDVLAHVKELFGSRRWLCSQRFLLLLTMSFVDI